MQRSFAACRAASGARAVLLVLAASSFAPAQEAPPQAPAAPPSAEEALLLEALYDLEAGEVTAALAKLERLRQGPQPPPQALAVLGGIYVAAQRPQEAFEVLAPLTAAADADPAVLYNAGRAAALLGEPRQAVDLLWRSLQREPTSPARRELGLLLGRLGQYQEAYASLRPWALAYPGDTEARRAAAGLAVELDRPLEAEELLAELPENDPGVRLLWGQTLLQKSDPLGAIGYLKPLLGAAPLALDDDVRRTAAMAYLLIGEAATAIELLRDQVEGNPGVALQLASAHYQSGDLDQAIAVLAPFAPKLPVAAPQALGARELELALEYGRMLSTAARHPEALPYLRLATERLPERAVAWQAYGQALAAAGQRAEAQAALERFQQLTQGDTDETRSINQQEADLRDPTGRELRAIWELALQPGKVDEALDRLSVQAEIAADDPRPALLASRLLLFEKRLDEALVAAERAAAIAGDSADSHYQRGVVLMAMGKLAEAEASLRRALALDPGHVASLSDLAVLLASNQRDAEARELLRRILELRPDDPAALSHLERLDRKPG